MGLFLVMEGPDGSGKGVQLDLLAQRLKQQGYSVLRSREPGGTPIGEKIRDVLLDPANKAMDPMTEALLYAASRSQHVAEKIKPALDRGQVVLLDRFVTSSLVYQGIGRGLGLPVIEQINDLAVQGLKPDLILLLYVSYEEGLSRKARQEGHTLDRLETSGGSFHEKVNEGYLQIARLHPDEIALVDGAGSVDEVRERIWQKVQPLLSAKGGKRT